MGADVAVVTANFGGIDEPRDAVAQEGYEDADWYYFTDWTAAKVPPPWEAFTSGATFGGDPRLRAKPYKLTPWVYGPIDEYRWIVWLDASMEVTNPRFLTEALASASCSGAPLTTWKHPRRTRVWDEAMASLREAPGKYDHRVIEQAEEYRRRGFRDDSGLYACGTLIWNLTDETLARRARVLGGDWLNQCERWTIQDQLSLPFVAWVLNEQVGTFPVAQVDGYDKEGGYCENAWLRIYDHLRSD